MCEPILRVWNDGNVRVFGAGLPMTGFPPEVTIRLSVRLHVDLRCIGAEVVGINLLSAANDEPKKSPGNRGWEEERKYYVLATQSWFASTDLDGLGRSTVAIATTMTNARMKISMVYLLGLLKSIVTITEGKWL
jgi:hypothetical protein